MRPARRPAAIAFGQLAVRVLNGSLRPFLAKWHPLLADHEATRGTAPPAAHERTWKYAGEVRVLLEHLRGELKQYADLLAAACRIPPLHDIPPAA